MNRVLLVGEVDSDEIFVGKTNNGDMYAKFTVHTWEAVPGKDFRHQRTTCVSYNSIAELMHKFGHKGKHLVVEGKLNHYQGKDMTWRTEVICERVVFTE